MRRLVAALVAASGIGTAVAAVAAVAAAPAGAAPGGDPATAGGWVVVLHEGAEPARVAPGLAERHGGTVAHLYDDVLGGFSFRGSAAAADSLRGHPLVRAVVADSTITLEDATPNGWWRIDGDDARARGAGPERGQGARIAVIDSGIDLTHRDLAPNLDLAAGANCVGGTSADDDNGHGTHVAGTAAAAKNADEFGVVGIAERATLVAVKAFDATGNATTSQVLCGIDHVAALAADGVPTVANMSWGESGSDSVCDDADASDVMHEAICDLADAGVVPVAAAGNSGIDAAGFVPAAFDEVITVAALSDLDGKPGAAAGCNFTWEYGYQCDDTMATFSNHSTIHVMAPGVWIYSSVPDDGHATMSGTSMAAPHVSGVVAIMRAEHPGLTTDEIRFMLQETGECPDGAPNDGGTTCAGQGNWPNDPATASVPLVNTYRAAEAAAALAPGAPDAPTGVTAAAVSSTQVDVAWADVSGEEGYRVERSDDGGTVWATVGSTVADDTAHSDLTAAPETSYLYRVVAHNAAGDSPPSASAPVTTPAEPPAPPPAPAGVTATAASATQVDVSWGDVADEDGYRVERSVDGGPWETAGTVGADSTAYSDTGLAAGTAHSYRVVATNAGGESPPSTTASATTMPAAPVLAATAVSDSQVDLSWTDVGGETGYRVERLDGSWVQIADLAAGVTSHSDAGLSPETGYSYRVFAYNAGGDSAASNVASATTDPAPAPDPDPTVVDDVASGGSTSSGSSSGTFADTHAADGVVETLTERESGGKPSNRHSLLEHTWTVPATGGDTMTLFLDAWVSGGEGEAFDVSISTDGVSFGPTLLTIGPGSSAGTYASAALPPGTSGTLHVRVVDRDRAAGNRALDSLHVDHLFVRSLTGPAVTPEAPSSLAVDAARATEVDLSWLDNSSNEHGFEVERSADGGTTWALAGSVGVDATTFTDAGLSAGTAYRYRVRATHSTAGASAWSNEVDATTAAADPVTLSATGYKVKGLQKADLAWAGATTADVEIWRDGVWIATVQNTGSWTDHVDQKGGGSYTYVVREAGGPARESAPATVVF